MTNGSVFYWNTLETYTVAKKIEITSSKTVYIGEIGIFNVDGERIYPINAPYGVTDEPETVPKSANYRNSTYFDEIYHARTGYELLHELPVYEWTHPPLGKIFISLGINLFGMTPFGWRIIGTLFGILMVPILYVFAKKMFGITWISALSTIIFSFDFMHFTQSRIATIDVYATFFIMLMYLFMYKYVNAYLGKKPTKNTLVPLGLSGLFMGFGIACKWTGAYGGVGLAVIFFSAIYLKYKNGDITAKDISKTVFFCIGAFGIIPVLIYVLSYIPFVRANDGGFYDIIQNQIDMFAYHGNTVVSSTHPFSSQWYKWIVNYRPIWYYSGTNGALSENISAFGNPIVWISGLLAFIYCVYDAIKNRDKNAIFLVVAYLAQLLPWTFVERITFIYHYFPCVPFLVLMIAHFVHRMYQKNGRVKYYFIAFAVVAAALFIMFYPVISGFPVNGDYVREFLRWLPSWQLIG
ncbi:MAG: glycosyltransferase family 39 protein [Clostridia bacterium]|nr:glycosyltransferase family 39 protein [Clostridia bacterium]